MSIWAGYTHIKIDTQDMELTAKLSKSSLKHVQYL